MRSSSRRKALPSRGKDARRCFARRSKRAFSGYGRTRSRSTTCTGSTQRRRSRRASPRSRKYRDIGKIRHVGHSQVGIDEIERAREIVPIAAVKDPLRFDAALDVRGSTLLHGDIRDEQIGLAGRRLALLDWGLSTRKGTNAMSSPAQWSTTSP
jgi:hypothetical protein